MHKIKLTIFIAFTIFSVIVFLFLFVLLYPWREKIGPALLQAYCKVTLKIFKVRIESADSLPVPATRDRGIILIANHVSMLDIFLMSALYRSVFLSKEEVRHYPVIGLAASLIGIVFLNRESPFDRPRVIRKIARNSNGRIITIYPQGTTGTIEDRLPFKRGIFKAVEINHGTILLPVTIRYKEDSEIAWRREQILIDNVKDICAQKRIHVKVTIHEPISIEHYSDRTVDEVRTEAQEKVFSRLQTDY
jgi:1-acyl-sn-glycerol-3-phosphate acyltransferase